MCLRNNDDRVDAAGEAREAKSREIDALIKADKKKQSKEVKLLLLGMFSASL